ncbi:hypothetical protein [Sulfuracidifex metallicus]|uniref:hypothetical protein n=1 Tax=Sulfuracidifex metallicus TaxID=47303 RepID=UPI0012DE001B
MSTPIQYVVLDYIKKIVFLAIRRVKVQVCHLKERELADFLPALEGRGFPSRGFIVPTIDSGLHLSFGGQSSGSENHSHLDRVGRGLSLLSSSPLKEKEDDGCSSHSPIKPPIELGRSIVSVTKRFLKKEIFKPFIRGLSIPALKGETFRPLNPLLCKTLILHERPL